MDWRIYVRLLFKEDPNSATVERAQSPHHKSIEPMEKLSDSSWSLFLLEKALHQGPNLFIFPSRLINKKDLWCKEGGA